MMKKLSQTWRQRAKFVEKTPSNIKRTKHDGQRQALPSALDGNSTSCNNDVPVDDKKDRMVSTCDEKVVEISHENSTRCSLLFNSFALDSQALFAVDEMEKEHMKCVSKTLDIASLSPIIPDRPLPTNLSGVVMDNNDKLGTTADRIDQIYKCGDQNKFISTPNDKFFEEGTSGDKCGKTSTSWVKETIGMTKGDTIGMSSKEDGLKSNIGVCDAKTSKLDNKETCNSTPSMKLHESPKTNENCKMDGDIYDRSSGCINSQGSTTQDSTGHCLTQDQCTLSSWGLPASILEQYHKIGIKTMFQWQAQCLRTGNVLNGGNLVYSAPTSAGKTMVAEILMLKRILETKCKALFILPFVSVAREKMFYMKRMFGGCGLTIDGYMGSQVPSKGFDSVDIAVCTIEKANGLVNRLMESGQLHLVGVIVVDEIHLIGDPSRGYLLELLLTKVLYVTQSIVDHNVQIIGMSATLPNLNTLATWLKADLYYTDYRPVPLTEYFKVGTVLYDRSGNVSRELDKSQLIDGDEEHLLLLCQETVVHGNGVLIFCPTKSWCEKLAEVIAKHFNKLLSTTEHDQKKSPLYTGILDIDALKDVFEQLRSCQVGLDGVLKKTLRYGVAYHHAGLTYDERDVIEAAFRNGVLKVLVATSTLSSGVNLPARRVIIRTPMFYGKLLDSLVYKQMSGRAGRKGVDSMGESILLCKANERKKALSLIEDELKPVKSCLVVKRSDEDEGNGIKRALLEVIASGVAVTPTDVQRYASCTLYVSSKTQEDGENTQTIIKNTVDYLVKNEFIYLRNKESTEDEYVPTQLGQATLASSLSPDEALVVFTDLLKARKCFVLENELHILYQVTPIYVQDQWPNLDWYQYLQHWERLPSHMKRVADLVGIEERFLSKAIRSQPSTRTHQQRQILRLHKRFYVTLALHDLIHEVALDVVARRYGASRGMLQSLQSSAATFSGMVTIFCHKLGWRNLEMLLSQFQNRLTFGVEQELCDLVRVSTLNAFRARIMYGAGYHTIASLAAAKPAEIERLLRNATPFQSNKKADGESERELRRRMRAKCVWVNGGRALTELQAAQEIVREACVLLDEDAKKLGMGLKLAKTCEVGEKAINDMDEDSRSKERVTCAGEILLGKTVECSRNSESGEVGRSEGEILGNTKYGTRTDLVSRGDQDQGIMYTTKTTSRGQDQGITCTTKMTSRCQDQGISCTTKTTSRCQDQGITFTTKTVDSPSNGSQVEKRNTGYLLNSIKENKVCDNVVRDNERIIEGEQQKGQYLVNNEMEKGDTQKTQKDVPVILHDENCDNQLRIIKEKTHALDNSNLQEAKVQFCAAFENQKEPNFDNTNAKVKSNVREYKSGKPSKVRQTPKRRRDSRLKRRHSMSKSPLDKNGPKIKATNQSDLSSKKQSERFVKTQSKSKYGFKDKQEKFYADCLENFNVTGQETPTRRKTRSFLQLQPSPCRDKQEGNNARNGRVLFKNFPSNCKGDSVVKYVDDSSSNNWKTGKSKMKSVDLFDEFFDDSSKSKKCDGESTKDESGLCQMAPLSRNIPVENNVEPEHVSPALITSSEQYDSIPIVCPTKTDCEIFDSSPELNTETIIPKSSFNSCQDVVEFDQFSESLSFNNLSDTSMLDVDAHSQDDEKMRKDAVKCKTKKSFDGVSEPKKLCDETRHVLNEGEGSKTPSDDQFFTYKDLLTPGLFDSEISFAQCDQVISVKSEVMRSNNNERCKSSIGYHRQGDSIHEENIVESICKQSTENETKCFREKNVSHKKKMMFSEQVMESGKYCVEPAEQCQLSAGQSQSSPDSFSLRLSQTFDCSDDSDLSSKTLAELAALEEKEMVCEDEQGCAQHYIGNEGNRCEYKTTDHEILADRRDDKYKEEITNDRDGPLASNVFTSLAEKGRVRLELSDIELVNNEGSLEAKGDDLGSQVFQNVSNISSSTLSAIDKEFEKLEGRVSMGKLSTSSPVVTTPLTKVTTPLTKVTTPLSALTTPSSKETTNEKRYTGIKQRHCSIGSWVDTSSKSAKERSCLKDETLNEHLSDFPLHIVDITNEKKTFENFIQECKTKSFSFSIAVEKNVQGGHSIGRRFNKTAIVSTSKLRHRFTIEEDNLSVVGIAVCLQNSDSVNYLSLDDRNTQRVAWNERIKCLQVIMGLQSDEHVKMAFDVKENYKLFCRACDVIMKGKVEDPKVAAWLLDPGAKEKNLLQLTQRFLPEKRDLSKYLDNRYMRTPRERSCVQATLVKLLMDRMRPVLQTDGLWNAFNTIEMPVSFTLARMELNGFGFSNNECKQIKNVLRSKLQTLERKAYHTAGRQFALSSPEDVSRVLFLELKIPPDGHAEDATSPNKLARPTRGGKRRKVKYFSTSKDVLEKLLKLHPLPKIILEWRKVNSALTKVVFPVEKEQVACGPPIGMSRLFPIASTNTATGRVTFVEPNLQNVPRDFEINLSTDIHTNNPDVHTGKTPCTSVVSGSPHVPYSVSLRSAFIPFSGALLLAADYSQLELRILSHLSGDEKLLRLLNTGGDVFRMIASEMFHIAQNDISDEQRQRSKHVCYGIIYGIGTKALGEALQVDEKEAGVFMDAFKARFTGVQKYLKNTVNECRRLGYVVTISGRRRYLSNIRSSNAAVRSHAERQAVNTTIQGSAADLVKLAMTNIDNRLCNVFPNCWRTHRHRGASSQSRALATQSGAYMVLQLHDELMFEVVEQDLLAVANIVKKEMEAAMILSVKLPIKMKSGKSWGTMVPYECPSSN